MFYLSQKLTEQCILSKVYENTTKKENKISKLKIYQLLCKVLKSRTKISEKREKNKQKIKLILNVMPVFLCTQT